MKEISRSERKFLNMIPLWYERVKDLETKSFTLILVCLVARFLRGQVSNLSGDGKYIIEGKSVTGDCKSEESQM